ncbi:MAG: phage tail protein [Ponticaulis sp.]|nr:phage tail protein [Ponticaulis sp.]
MAISSAAQAQEKLIGEVFMTGANFCPRGTAMADGQLLPISQYSALFSLYGTNYGGDGRTTFGLPDLRGRAPMHQGRGPGLTDRRLGQKFGAETTTLTVSNMPSHTHQTPNAGTPETFMVAPGSEEIEVMTPSTDSTTSTANTGLNQNFNNIPPVLVMNYCVVIDGIYPSRN